MTYVDFKRVEDGKPVEEYVGRMNKAINDGIEEGISEEYFERNLRPYIPVQSNM
jgi:gamma-glutamylcyclotransferase